jgi:hypothetical protein
MDIHTLVKSKPALGTSLSPVIDRLKKTDTQVGKALIAAAKAGKK